MTEFTEDKQTNLKDYLWVIRKRKWSIIAFLAIIITVVSVASFKMKPVYRATTQLLIEKENPNVLSFEEVMTLDTSNTYYYQTQYKILKSRSLIKRVIDKLNLKENPEFTKQKDNVFFQIK